MKPIRDKPDGFSVKWRILLTALVAVTVSACATTDSSGKDSARESQRHDAIEMLREVSIEARHEMRLLAKMQEAQAMEDVSEQQRQQRAHQASTVPPGFEQHQDFLFSAGYARDAVEAMAMMAGYDFRPVNSPEGAGIPVSIRVQDRPLNEVLRELGAQTGDLATIKVFPEKSLIELEYEARKHGASGW